MAETACTAAAEAVRPFSGPPLPSGVVAHCDEVSPSFSLEIARAALLELRKSVTSADFDKLIDDVTSVNAVDSGSAISERPDESSVVSESESDGEMDTTSSDGGSTVRELNEQLMSGNTGNGIDESSMSGNMNSTDVDVEWNIVTTRKRKKSKSSEVSPSGAGTDKSNKKGRIDSDLFVYLKGADFDIAKEASGNPLDFSRKLASIAGAVGEVKLLKGAVRVTCAAPKQKATLLLLDDWFGKPVNVSEPWSKAPSGNRPRADGNRRPTLQKGIIFGVSIEVTEYDIQSETKAEIARRITKFVDGQRTKTESVVLSYPDTLPDVVCIGFLRYRVRPYIPQPTRCTKCQGYGHIAAYCKRQARCVRCGKGHSLEECPAKDDVTRAVCVNCKGQHSAAFRGCSKYQEVSKALRVSVIEKLSYRDALVKVKSGVLQRTTGGVEAVHVRPLQTSTPISAPATAAPSRPALAPPPARRELFEATTSKETMPDDRDAGTSAKPASDAHQPQSTGYTMRDFMKQITHHLLYTLAILEGLKPVSEFAQVRRNLTNLASSAFGMHGAFPCLSPKCST